MTDPRLEITVGARFAFWGGQLRGAYIDSEGRRWPHAEVPGIYKVVSISNGEVVIQSDLGEPFATTLEQLRAVLVYPWSDPNFMTGRKEAHAQNRRTSE